MKKPLSLALLAVMLMSLLAACGSTNQANSPQSESEGSADTSADTRIYASENGDVELPANPERVAVLAHIYVGNVLQLGIKPVAVSEWVQGNKAFEGMLDGVEVVTEGSIEKLLELEPDLILALTSDQNISKYEEIAPTVSFTYGTTDYLQQHIEIGKMLGKEQEARAWVEEWNEKTGEAAVEVIAAIGEDATVSVIEPFGKDIFVYGNDHGRGTEIMYQAFGLQAPDKIVEDAFGPGYKAISAEVIPQYAGDYLFVGIDASAPANSFMETEAWKNIPAVQNNRVFEYDAQSFWFNDPISLELQLDFVIDALTGGSEPQ